MDLMQTIKERKSVRAFRPDPVPRELLETILGAATCAPSAINLQPWEFTVVIGDERQRLSRLLIKSYREKRISCSPGNVKPLAEVFSRRGFESFKLMEPFLEEMGLEFNSFVNEGSCNFYGAPVAIILSLDNAFSEARFVDMGITLAYIILAAHNFGLSTCPIGLINAYEEEIKEVLNIQESKRVVIGIALGYPDPDSPINRFKTPREGLENFVRWVE